MSQQPNDDMRAYVAAMFGSAATEPTDGTPHNPSPGNTVPREGHAPQAVDNSLSAFVAAIFNHHD